jgi:hypothetical protein
MACRTREILFLVDQKISKYKKLFYIANVLHIQIFVKSLSVLSLLLSENGTKNLETRIKNDKNEI